MLNTIIISFSILFSLIVALFSIKTLIDTRKKYYSDYIKRKRNGKH